MKLVSSAFQPEQPIPVKYTADGENISPPIRWEGVPQRTKELALVCEDPDAPKAEPFVHWVAYHIPPDLSELHEDIKPAAQVNDPPDLMQGPNDMGTIGYTGPEPPPGHGTHHYHFRLYALDTTLELLPRQDLRSLVASMSGHIIDSAELVGTYERMR